VHEERNIIFTHLDIFYVSLMAEYT